MDSATLLTIRVPAFDAAIRKAVEPRLACRPVVVVTSFKPLGRVAAACPQAREAGIAEEMHYQAARVLCPDAAFFLPDPQLAQKALDSLTRKAGAYSPLVESAGGGRIVLDTRGTERLWGDSGAVADRLRRDIGRRMHLPVAAGLAVRRPWSLLASRSAGDGGVCHVVPGGEDVFLDQVPIAWVDGISPRTRVRLMELNLRTLGQLRSFTREQVFLQFGRGCGKVLWDVLHPGAWDMMSPASALAVVDDSADVVRAEATLAEASVVEECLAVVVRSLAERVAAELRARGLGAARMRLTLLYADGVVKGALLGTGGFVQDEIVLAEVARSLLRQVFKRRVRATRMWLTAERLSGPERQGVLFASEGAAKGEGEMPLEIRRERERLLATVDGIRKRYGDESLRPAVLLSAGRLSPRAG